MVVSCKLKTNQTCFLLHYFPMTIYLNARWSKKFIICPVDTALIESLSLCHIAKLLSFCLPASGVTMTS